MTEKQILYWLHTVTKSSYRIYTNQNIQKKAKIKCLISTCFCALLIYICSSTSCASWCSVHGSTDLQPILVSCTILLYSQEAEVFAYTHLLLSYSFIIIGLFWVLLSDLIVLLLCKCFKDCHKTTMSHDHCSPSISPILISVDVLGSEAESRHQILIIDIL